MPPRILEAIVEKEEEQCPRIESEENSSQDNEDIEERLRTIVGPAIQATPQSPPANADRRSGLPLSQLLNPIDPIRPMTRANPPEGVDYSGLPYLNNRIYVKRQHSPPNLLELESHFNDAYEASLAAAVAAAAPAPASSPLSRWFGDLTTTPPPESSDEELGGMREADELDSSSDSDPDDDSSDWWEDEEPPSGPPPSAVLAPAPHLVLPINIWRIEVSALQYTPPASPADREMVLMPSPLPRPRSLPVMAAPTRTPPPPPPPPPPASYCGEDSRFRIKKEAHSLPLPSCCGEDSEVPMKIKKEEEEEEEEASSPSPQPLLGRFSGLRIKKEDEEEEEADDVLSSSTLDQSPSEYSATNKEEEGADAVKTEVTMEEIQVAIESEVKAAVKVEVGPKVKLEGLPTSGSALVPVPVPGLVPALESESTAGAEPMIRKRSRSGWTSINGPDAKRRKFMN